MSTGTSSSSIVSSTFPPSAFPHLEAILLAQCRNFRPRLRPPLSVWSEQNITLSKEYADKASRLRLYQWQREIFDAFTDPYTNEITGCMGVQLTKTLLIQCAMAYCIAEDQGPILIVQPKQDDAKAFSKERLGPMIRDCEVLRGLISESEKEGNTILTKEFPGGSVAIVGAISPGNLARRSIRYIFFDEVDKYPASAGKEGDPLTLGRERTITFGHRRKIVYTCSPTISGQSRIMKSYMDSDRRKPYVPCHACGTMQVLNFRTQVKFDTSIASELQHTTAYYQCSNVDCNAKWTDEQRWKACQQAVWRAEKPFQGHAGFWINHLYSPYKTISMIVKDYLAAKDNPQQLQSFTNTTLAEVWEVEGSAPDPDILYGRREPYPHTEMPVIPMRGLFLTAAVDVQESPPRLECEVVAWGRDRENWSIGYYVIQKQAKNGELLPVTSPELWQALDQEVLQALYQHESGHQLPIMVMCIDTGRTPKPVYEFALRHSRLSVTPAGARPVAIRTVVPVKGNDDPLRIISGISKENQAIKRQNIRIVSVGTHCAKQELFELLKGVKPAPDGSAVPGCHHFPMYDLSYFQMLAAETRVVHEETGKVEYVRKPGMPNEGLDLKIYGRAAATLVGIDRFSEVHWRKMEIPLGIPDPNLAKEDNQTNDSDVSASVVDPSAPKPAAPSPVQPIPPAPKRTVIPDPASAPHLQSIQTLPPNPTSPSPLGRGRKIRGTF